MPMNFVPEGDLYEALRPHRADPSAFEAGIRARLEAAETAPREAPLGGPGEAPLGGPGEAPLGGPGEAPLGGPGEGSGDAAPVKFSPLLRAAASLLPLPVLAGCKGAGVAAKLGPASGISKALGYLAFPAICLFVLLGATIFGAAKVRGIRKGNAPASDDELAIEEAIRQWWRRHKWPAIAVYIATLTLSWIGATWLLFLFYIASCGLLLFVLAGFGKLGLGNRWVIGSSCGMALVFLAQFAGFANIGNRDIHFVDQSLIAAVLMTGSLLTFAIAGQRPESGDPRRKAPPRWGMVGTLAALALPLIAWQASPILWPATPARIKNYVESFNEAPNSSVSWSHWEIPASWTIESGLNPDLSGARQLLSREIAGEQNPFILGTAFRIGLVQHDQLGQLKNLEFWRRSLLPDGPRRAGEAGPIFFLSQMDWVIRALALRGDLSPDDRDHLEERLHATLRGLSDQSGDVLEEALRATQLLEIIGRPIDRDRYRASVHDWLRKFHVVDAGWFQMAGGFKQYPNVSSGSLEVTAHAVELMKIYGVPDGLDLDWVRSFLRPMHNRGGASNDWIAAVALDRLDHLPGVRRPSWSEFWYRERSLAAAIVLVGLCIYATLLSPKPGPAR